MITNLDFFFYNERFGQLFFLFLNTPFWKKSYMDHIKTTNYSNYCNCAAVTVKTVHFQYLVTISTIQLL